MPPFLAPIYICVIEIGEALSIKEMFTVESVASAKILKSPFSAYELSLTVKLRVEFSPVVWNVEPLCVAELFSISMFASAFSPDTVNEPRLFTVLLFFTKMFAFE